MSRETNPLAANPRYKSAAGLLDSILKKEIPGKDITDDIYGKLSPMIVTHLEKYYSEHPHDGKEPRAHIYHDAVIEAARLKLEKDIDFAKLHSTILLNRPPEISELKLFYGQYSKTVKQFIELYQKHGLKRKCGIPSAAHPNRVAGIIHTLNFDKDNPHKFSSVAAIHDGIEDMLVLEMGKSRDHKGVNGLNIFIDKYIPEELQDKVKLLTNHYSLIINYIEYLFKITDKPKFAPAFFHMLESFGKERGPMQEYAHKISALLADTGLKEPVFPNAKWECYKGLYIKEMADKAKAENDNRTFEIKAVDLSDNALGNAALSASDKIRNLLKLSIWAKEGYCLHTDWKPTNNIVKEVMEDALNKSEQFVIKDFLEPVSKQDFFVSALNKIEELKEIFYI